MAAPAPLAQHAGYRPGVAVAAAATESKPVTGGVSRVSVLLGYPPPLAAAELLRNPVELQALLRQVLGPAVVAGWRQQLPDPAQLGWQHIAASLSGSGLLIKNSRGSAARPATLMDLFMALQQALRGAGQDVLREPGPSASSQLGRVMDYLESSLLQTLLAQANHRMFARFPLLLSDRPAVEVQLWRQPGSEDDEEASWQIDLDLPMDEQRHVWVACRLTPGLELHATLWSSCEVLASLMLSARTGLQGSLGQAGIRLASCAVHHGVRPVTAPDRFGAGMAVDISA